MIALDANDKTGSGIDWPPYSPDLSACDYWLWGYIKDKVYRNSPQTIDDLKHNIKTTIEAIDTDMLGRVMANFEKRLEYVVAADGGHFENLII